MPRISCALVMAGALALAFPNITQAICDDVENGIGVYFDSSSYTVNCLETAPAVPITMYFVLRNCSLDAIGGYEFAWRIEPDADPAPLVLGSTWPCGIDVWDPYNVIIGCGTPLTTTGPTLLLSVQLYFLVQPELTFIQVGPATPSSLPGYPAIGVLVDGDLVIEPMNFCGGGAVGDVTRDAEGWSVPGVAVLLPHACDGVAAQPSSWGTIKSFYR